MKPNVVRPHVSGLLIFSKSFELLCSLSRRRLCAKTANVTNEQWRAFDLLARLWIYADHRRPTGNEDEALLNQCHVAAEQLVTPTLSLGECYLTGRGIPRDPVAVKGVLHTTAGYAGGSAATAT